MRKILLLAAPLALTIASAGSALALRTNGASYTVSFDGQRVGTWTLRNKVEDRDTVCRYTVRWHDLSGPPITRTSLCKIDETKAGDNFDCEQARRGGFSTIVQKAGGTCTGFDSAGQQTNVNILIGGENDSGQIHGVVEVESTGDVQNLTVE